jgi:hypothetical protein
VTVITRAPSAPARKPQAARKPAQPAEPAKTRAQVRAESLNDYFKAGALFAVVRGWYADAGACQIHGPGISREVAIMAEGNDKVGKLVDYLTEAGPYMGLATAVLPFVFQLAANHGRIDAKKIPPGLGIVDPAELESNAKKAVAEETARLEAEMAMAAQPSNGVSHGA